MNRAFLVFVCLELGCVQTQTIASRYLKSQLISAPDGGGFTVLDTENEELAGFSLTIPPGALSADTQVTLEVGLDDLVAFPDSAANRVAIIGPSSVVLTRAATIGFPYVSESDEERYDIDVLRSGDGGQSRVAASDVFVDARTHQVTISTTNLGSFQVIQRHCISSETCAPGVCVAGRCRGPQCGSVTCAPGATCCDASCGSCASAATACPPTPCTNDCNSTDCGPVLGVPACVCPNDVACSPNRCARNASGGCSWQLGTCP